MPNLPFPKTKISVNKVIIQGGGDSIYGSSQGMYCITEGEGYIIDKRKNQFVGSVSFFGPDTQWYQYTDSQIEKEVGTKMEEEILKCLGLSHLNETNVEVNWSEQGLQPRNGWNFDVTVHVE